MKSAGQWLHEYGRAHENPHNQRIHKICVPLIYWSICAILWRLPRPGFMADSAFINWATLVLVPVLGFYLSLGLVYFLAMLVMTMLMLATIIQMENWKLPVMTIALIIFVMAWIGQFVGHKIEGRRPAFLTDLQFLLIGPIWILHTIPLEFKDEP